MVSPGDAFTNGVWGRERKRKLITLHFIIYLFILSYWLRNLIVFFRYLHRIMKSKMQPESNPNRQPLAHTTITRKGQGVPQSEAATNTKRKRKMTRIGGCKINKQMHEKQTDPVTLYQANVLPTELSGLYWFLSIAFSSSLTTRLSVSSKKSANFCSAI